MRHYRSAIIGLLIFFLSFVTFVKPGSAIDPINIQILDPGIKFDTSTTFNLDISKAPVIEPGWSVSTDYIFYGKPVVAKDGTIYVAVDVKGMGYMTHVLAYTPSGILIWKFEYDGKVMSTPFIGPDDDIYISVHQNKLLRISPKGQLVNMYRLQYDAYEFIGFGPDGSFYYTSETGQSSAQLISFDPELGETEWIYKDIAKGGDVELGQDGSIIFLSDDHKVLYIIRDGIREFLRTSEDGISGLKSGPFGEVFADFGTEILRIDSSRAEKSFKYNSDSEMIMLVDKHGSLHLSEFDILIILDSNLNYKLRLKMRIYYPFSMQASGDFIYVSDEWKNLYALQDGILQWRAELNLSKDELVRWTIGPEGNVYYSDSKKLEGLILNKITSIAINKPMISLEKGQEETLFVSIHPYNVAYPHVVWSSSNPTVASVDQEGHVIGHTKGQAEIQAATIDGTMTVSSEVRVNDLTVEKPKFSDIDGHKYKDSIEKAVQIPITEGYPDGTFKPEGKVTRAEFAVLLMKALKTETPGKQLTFKDKDIIPSWAEDYIVQAFDKGIIQGYPDGTFRPSGNITHAEMVSMVMKASGMMLEEDKTAFADDVNIPAWARAAVFTAEKNGIILTDEWDGKFHSTMLATRAEAVTFIVRLLEWIGK